MSRPPSPSSSPSHSDGEDAYQSPTRNSQTDGGGLLQFSAADVKKLLSAPTSAALASEERKGWLDWLFGWWRWKGDEQ